MGVEKYGCMSYSFFEFWAVPWAYCEGENLIAVRLFIWVGILPWRLRSS